ncbi:DNA-binding transcriptional LysR family regulator [Isoptericola jiangsuensis]|uniref:DNA-binding transcriptional LysR family regulator n=1 Tax=Isoptericola jiangsuensis TaxID=548579 RepID=A0A2A9EUG9_9MICO|nr:LysR family transcriptional regulator [Isoptericola jiangsuensis]PFG41922.1 DNA-binding transcriptional LysR family regulator [Isoptericola jiangsuensis]
MDIDLRHLRLVTVVAEQGSVTKASNVLGMAQPALTAQLNRIDNALGGPCFVRDRHGTRPTPLGELVLRHARVLLPAMDAFGEDVRRHVQARTGDVSSLRVGTVTTVLGGLFLNRLRSGLGGVALTSYTSWSPDEAAARLRRGTLDIALVGACENDTLPTDGDVEWVRLHTDPVFVLLAEGHRLAGPDAVPLAELAGESWLTAPGDGCFERCFVAACTRAGFAPHEVSEVERASAVEQVRDGHAVALVQPLLLDQPGVVPVPIEGEPLSWSQYVGWRRDAVERFDVDVVRASALGAHAEAVRRSPAYTRYLAARVG